MKDKKADSAPSLDREFTVNYPAIEYLGWFNSDVQNVQGCCSSIFRNGFFKTDPNFPNLKLAALKALDEVQDDVNALKAFLNKY
jgi:hypothetical protein